MICFAQRNSTKHFLYFILAFLFLSSTVTAQVNTVEFGKNRVQYKKFNWQYIQTNNFNVYYNGNGKALAQFVAQMAEQELIQIEKQTEFSLQRRIDVMLYNEYGDMEQSNIGMEQEWQKNNGVAKFVNNKMVLYYEVDHYKLKIQVRSGIAGVIINSRLFGENFGERTQNRNFLDLPAWFINGYIAYVAERWSTQKDDQLKNEMLSGKYKKFYALAFKKPELAGHAFWYYIDEQFKKENAAYFLYLVIQKKNINTACKIVTKQNFKGVLKNLWAYNFEKYDEDVNRRKPYPKGTEIESFYTTKRRDYFRFNVNPNKRDDSYVGAFWKKGIVRVKYYNADENKFKTLIKYGARTDLDEINPLYPMTAWDNKGTRIAVTYLNEGRINFFVYDIVTRVKPIKLDLSKYFDQIQDMKYMPDYRRILFSAVRNGQSDLYIMDIEKEKLTQVTNDIYDDVDATYINFPNKPGIIFSSNRPSPYAKSDSTVLPGQSKFNVFMTTNFGEIAAQNQITQLTNLKYGNARSPMQYNVNHFTFVSDESGIANRWAGFFVTKAAGIDTLVMVNKVLYRNPSLKEVDSILTASRLQDVDSILYARVTEDSTYTFPITNYESSLAETRTAGDNGQVSEVTQQGDEKTLYKLKINEDALRRRNITARPSAYGQRMADEENMRVMQIASDDDIEKMPAIDTITKLDDFFQSEFVDTVKAVKDASGAVTTIYEEERKATDVLQKAKYFVYKPVKYHVDAVTANLATNVLVQNFERYTGGTGPIYLNAASPLSGMIRVGTKELMEDKYFTGGYRLGSGLKDNEWYVTFQNNRKRLDWGATYYRNVQNFTGPGGEPIRGYTNLYQGNIKYALNKNKSFRLTAGVRSDDFELLTANGNLATILEPRNKTTFLTTRMEFINDNSQVMQNNILRGVRYKAAFDFNSQINKVKSVDGPSSFVASFDGRVYEPIFRNFIWAGRLGAYSSFGNQKQIYYLGGVDGWLMLGNNAKNDGTFRYFNENNRPDQSRNYAFQTLAVNVRGHLQNVAHGTNAIVINSEFRLPIISTLFDRPITSKFLNDLQLIQFTDLGTAFDKFADISRPENIISNGPVTIRQKVGGIGPLVGGYGFGARTTLLGYFVRFDAAWQMHGLFKGKPKYYLSFGLDF
jgi:hypothetical protein